MGHVGCNFDSLGKSCFFKSYVSSLFCGLWNFLSAVIWGPWDFGNRALGFVWRLWIHSHVFTFRNRKSEIWMDRCCEILARQRVKDHSTFHNIHYRSGHKTALFQQSRSGLESCLCSSKYLISWYESLVHLENVNISI